MKRRTRPAKPTLNSVTPTTPRVIHTVAYDEIVRIRHDSLRRALE